MKSLILLIIFFSGLAGILNAQPPGWDWERNSTGPAFNGLGRMSIDSKGNVYLVGSFDGGNILFGDNTLVCADSTQNIFIVKYDSSGVVIWAKALGQTGFDNGAGIYADAGGNVYVAGNFSDSTIIFGKDTLTNGTDSADIFLAKYDSSGNEIWARVAEGRGNISVAGMSMDGNGNIYLTGSYNCDTLIFGNDTLISTVNTQNTFFTKYDSSGATLLVKSTLGAGIYGESGGFNISTDLAGNIYVTGFFTSQTLTFGSYTLYDPKGSLNIFLTKYSSSGTAVWAKNIGGMGTIAGSSVATDGEGNIYLGGTFTRDTVVFGNYFVTNSGGENIFVVKFDSSGSVLWARNAGLTGAKVAVGDGLISVDAESNVYFTGGFDGGPIIFGTDTLTPADTTNLSGEEDIFAVKYDSSGIVIWAISIGGNNSDYGRSILSDREGNVYLAGQFTSSVIIFGTDTVINPGFANIFLAKLGATVTGIEYPPQSRQHLNIYPNPAERYIIADAGSAVVDQYTITDLAGRELQVINVKQQGPMSINVSGLATGMYFLHTMPGDAMTALKFCVVR